MKTLSLFLTLVTAAAFVFVGCKKSGVDTKPIESSFSSAEPATKSGADKAVSAIKAGDYASAMAELQKLAGQAKLTPEQQQAIKDVLEQVKAQISAAAEKAAGDAKKGMEDLQKSINK
jgi:hypothetical protein